MKLTLGLVTILVLYIGKMAHIYRHQIKRFIFFSFEILKKIKNDKVGLIAFFIIWLVLMSPAVVGVAIGVIFGNKYMLGVGIFWITLTSTTPFPVPVVPTSLAGAIIISKEVKRVISTKRGILHPQIRKKKH